MTAEEIREQIVWVINNVRDPSVLKDMLVLVNAVFRHYTAGTWKKK